MLFCFFCSTFSHIIYSILIVIGFSPTFTLHHRPKTHSSHLFSSDLQTKMQATLLPLSPSLSLYKSRSSSPSILNPSISSSSFSSCTPLVFSSHSSKFISLTPLHHSSTRFQTKATTTIDSSDTSPLFKALELGVLFCLWFSFNIYFNIYNKQVLKVYHLPVTLTAFQFAIGTLLVAFMWGLNLYKRPKFTSSQVFTFILLLFYLFCFCFILF